MPTLLLRALPPDIHRALKQAALHGRSLEREVQAILQDAVGDALAPQMDVPILHVSNAPMAGKVGRAEIYGGGR